MYARESSKADQPYCSQMNADPSDAVGGRKRGQRLKALEPLHESWTEYVSLQEVRPVLSGSRLD